ncbi:MAG: zinc ABC transporter substrate-binding protein [Desulfarculus sp.]|nr:zinc ABC transporter substrate-binding protein [Desulfarculus sp.]
MSPAASRHQPLDVLTRLGLLALFGLALAASPPTPAAAAPAWQVATGIPPLGYLLERLTGGQAGVRVLVGPGQNPHTYEPTPRQRAALAQAKAYFKLGLPFENTLLAKLNTGPEGLKVVDLAQGLELAPAPEEDHHHGDARHGQKHQEEKDHDEGELDLHLWLSPRLTQHLVRAMAQALKDLDPAGAAGYDQRLQALLADLERVDQHLAQVLAPHRGSYFLVYHPAFGYFGRDYGLKQVAVETGGKEPGARHLAGIIKKARERHIKVIFVQPQFPQKSAQQVAREIGGAVVAMDDLAPDYLANLERLARELDQGLKGQKRP